MPTNTILLLVIIILLVCGNVYLRQNQKEPFINDIKDGLDSAGDWIEDKYGATTNYIEGVGHTVADGTKDAYKTSKGSFIRVGNELVGAQESVADFAENTYWDVRNGVVKVYKDGAKGVMDTWEKFESLLDYLLDKKECFV